MMHLQTIFVRLVLILIFSLCVEDAAAFEKGLDVLEGFDDAPTVQDPIARPIQSASHLRFTGWLKLGSTYNFIHHASGEGEIDWHGLSRLRPELLLEGDLRLSTAWRLFASIKGSYDLAYAINGREDYTDEILDEYEKELELREAFVSGPLSESIDFKLGRQIAVWGCSDNIRVTDILNPLDQREPGLTDIEDLRLPVTMARLDTRFGPWTLTGLIIPEIRFDKQPVYGHDLYPYDQSLPPEKKSTDGFENAEYAAALTGIFSGWDISFYWARLYDDQPHMELSYNGSLALEHSRLTMLGISGERALGNFLLFGEAALFDGLEFFNAKGTFSRTDLLVGVAYSGFRDTTVSLEMARHHLNGYQDRLGLFPDDVDQDVYETVLRLSRTFWHERLTLTVLAFTFNGLGQDGALQRLQGEYELTDDLTVTVGAVFFKSGDLPAFSNISDNDRFFTELKWSF